MKSFLVVNQLNDPFYIDYDTQFADYIFRRAKDGGFIEEDAEGTELDANLVMQLFSPLVLSQWLLIDQTKEPCSSILCPDGFCFAFRHTDDLLFIAVNGDGTESEAFLHRKTQAFIMIMRFIFGPVNEELSQTHAHSRKGKWNFLRQLMQNWSDMVESEQAFLVEAIERLHVNQMVNEKCMEILLKSVKQFQTSKDLPTHHAMLLVNSKLLALYSNRSANELRPKDLLMTIILSKTMYPQTDRLEDLFSKFYSNTSAQAVLSTVDDNSDPGDDEYHSVPNTPRDHRSQSPASSEKSATEKAGATQDQDSQSEKSFEKITLLDLFKEKCSDDNLTKQSISKDFPSVCDELEESKEQAIKTSKRYSSTFSVEAIVHHPAVTATEHPEPVPQSEDPFYNSSPPTRGQACADSSDKIWSEFENQKECSPTSVTEATGTAFQTSGQFQISDHIKHEKTEKRDESLPIKSIVLELKEEASIEVAKSKHSDGSSNVQPLTESSEKEMFENRENSLLAKKYADPDSMPQTEEHNIQSHAREINSSIIPVPDSDLKPTSSDLNSDTSSQSLVAASIKSHSLMDRISLSSRDSSTTELNSKSRNSTPSQHSGEADVPSRTSSVISNLSKSYPELLAQSGRDLPSVYSVSSPLEDLSCEITRSRQITAAVGNLRSDTSAVTVTESSTVTVETVKSQSTYGSSTSSMYLPQTIFLETSTCLYSPYNLHTTQIFPGVTLLMLSQAPRYALADSLYQVIQTIKDLVYGRRSKLPRNRSIYVYETISAQLGKIHNGLKKLKGRAQNISSDVYARWEKEDLKHKLLDFLERDTTYQIPPEISSDGAVQKAEGAVFTSVSHAHGIYNSDLGNTGSN